MARELQAYEVPLTVPRPRVPPTSKLFYQTEIFNTIRENPAFLLTLREVMRMRMIPSSKATHMIAAAKKMVQNSEIVVMEWGTKAQWLDAKFCLKSPSGEIV